jgi:hypothetical protein
MTHHRNPNGTSGEPGAGTTGTPGSGGDSGKLTGRNADRAPRVDLTPGFRFQEVCRSRTVHLADPAPVLERGT